MTLIALLACSTALADDPKDALRIKYACENIDKVIHNEVNLNQHMQMAAKITPDNRAWSAAAEAVDSNTTNDVLFLETAKQVLGCPAT